MKKNKGFHFDWKMVLAGGFVSVFIVGGVFVSIRDQIGKVWAAPQRVDELEEQQKLLVQQTTSVYEWVKQAEKDKELEEIKRKAPPGYVWDEELRNFVRIR